MKMEQTERSEMSAYKIQMPGNYPEESTQQDSNSLHATNDTEPNIPYSEHSKSLKLKITVFIGM